MSLEVHCFFTSVIYFYLLQLHLQIPTRIEPTLCTERIFLPLSHLISYSKCRHRKEFSNASFTEEEQEVNGIIKQWLKILLKQFYQVTAWYQFLKVIKHLYTSKYLQWHLEFSKWLLWDSCTSLAPCSSNTGSQFLIAVADHEFSLDWFPTCIYWNYAGSLWQSQTLNLSQLTLVFRRHWGDFSVDFFFFFNYKALWADIFRLFFFPSRSFKSYLLCSSCTYFPCDLKT